MIDWQEALLQHPELLLAFLRSLSCVVAILDLEGAVLDCNQHFANLVGQAGREHGRLGECMSDEDAHSLSSLDEGETCTVRWRGSGREGAAELTMQATRVDCRVILLGRGHETGQSGTLQAMSSLNNDLVNLSRELAHKNAELEMAQHSIKTLRGLVPICASCKRIRDDSGYWRRVEEYVSAHSEAMFSHGICPECMVKLYGDMAEELHGDDAPSAK